MSVSIKDIAKKAGVSPSTVSRALRDDPSVNTETKAQIQAIARSMSYVSSAAARSLVVRRSATIGVAVADLRDPHYARLMSGIEDIANEHNYKVMLSSFYRNPEHELAVVLDFHERRMDGIIIAGSSVAQAYLSSDSKFFKPIVLVNSPAYPHSVSINGFLGAKKVVEYLIDLGHRRIAYITWGSKHVDELNRLGGYRTALSEHKIPYDDSLIVAGDGGISGGIKATTQLLNLPQLPTAIFGFNDMTAIGVINALRKNGHTVPRDFSVAGYDDVEMAAYYFPTLTTVRQPTYRAGRKAFEMLLKLINDEVGVVPEVLDPKLVVRESTATIMNEQ
jgi:DNA-binding LacI/PurR family transcriptional regulator